MTYLRLAWRRRWARERTPVIPAAATATLVTICHGNILRSPYAEALLKRPAVATRLAGLRVSSAGLHALPGKSADPRGVTVARESGVDLSTHRATQLSDEIAAAADLILVMDHLNAAEVASRHPRAAEKVVLLGSFDPASGEDPVIPDPYTGDLDAVRTSYRRVGAAVDGLVTALSAGNQSPPTRRSR